MGLFLIYQGPLFFFSFWLTLRIKLRQLFPLSGLPLLVLREMEFLFHFSDLHYEKDFCGGGTRADSNNTKSFSAP